MKFSILPVSLLLLCTPLTLVRADLRDWGAEANGLKMRISPDDTGDSGSTTPAFRVELINSGESDFVLNLGLMLANGDKQYPRAVVLIVTDGTGKLQQFELIEPAHIFGRADPLVVPLPAGCTFSIPVRLNKYLAVAPMKFGPAPIQWTGLYLVDDVVRGWPPFLWSRCLGFRFTHRSHTPCSLPRMRQKL